MNLTPAGPHLLDTSAVLHLLRGRQPASPEALVPFATMGELAVGVARSSDPVEEARRVRTILTPATPVLPTIRTAFSYGSLVAKLQRQGTPIPINDAWNAALALELNVPLLADDAHFERVAGLRLLPVRPERSPEDRTSAPSPS